MIDEVVAFVRARLDERERDAAAAAGEVGPDWYYDTRHGRVASHREQDLVATGSQDHLGRECGAHIARHDPASVLREVAAQRHLIDDTHWGGGPETEDAYHQICRILATAHAGHPDYKTEWAPYP
ncbi:DUF6221 family protein [Embleya sp. NPDC005971]|uniref:DUF6221 family protein n=1 Tax=Embleya sp. NPDC005971 TaxID=3156724 RepID=UPI00340ABF17